MINCIVQILDLVIKLSIVAGFGFLIVYYLKIKSLDKKIEQENMLFEQFRDKSRKEASGRGISQPILDVKINHERERSEERIAPLKRKRERLISKIPFLK